MEYIFKVDSDKKDNYLKSIRNKNELTTYELYRKAIIKLDKFEKYKGFSANQMSRIDFIEFLTSLNSSSLSSLYTYKSAISSYLEFIFDKKKITIGGYFDLEDITQDDLLYCINFIAESMQFITEEEYHNIITEEDGNYQDKLAVVLLWNRIKGDGKFADLLNLKVSDVDLLNKKIYLKGNEVSLSDIEITVVKNAIEEKSYVRTVRDKKGKIIKTTVKYVEGEYLVKATLGKSNKNVITNQCISGTFANRMSKYYNIVLNKSGLTNLGVYTSSVYFYMLKEYKRKLSYTELEIFKSTNNVRFSLSNSFREQDIMFNKMKSLNLFIYEDEEDSDNLDDFICREKEFIEDSNLPNDKTEITIDKIKRYQKIVKTLKKLYNNQCQIEGCNFTFIQKNQEYYSEAHHLIFLSNDGNQNKDNVVILCPNHHRMMHFADVQIFDVEENKRMIVINGVENFIVYK